MAMTTPTSYSWLKEYIDNTNLSVHEMADLLGMHSFEIEQVYKVGDEDVIDVDILPNRSSDCLSHLGIAREIALLASRPLDPDPLNRLITLHYIDDITVDIADPKACPRFGAALITGITVKESPDWLRKRLEAIGQRSINNVVDATNYVMFSLGQPLHAYDAEKFPQKDGKWQFGVRFAKKGETITTLTGEEYECDERVQLIIDNSNDMPAGIAGIKGGKYAEVDESTTSIILEAANFDPAVTRKSSTFLRLKTDASKRFENEVPSELIRHALYECARLIEDIAHGSCEGFIDKQVGPEASKGTTRVSLKEINSLLGLSLTTDEVSEIFKRVLGGSSLEGEEFTVGSPWWRTDLNIPEDYIEEIGRVYGYKHVVSVVPETVPLTEINARHYYSERVREVLTSQGFFEVITSSFRKKDQIQLRNALASDKSYLRSRLTKNVTEVLDQNATRADLFGMEDTRVFEIGTVFEKDDSGHVAEHVSLAVGVRVKPAYSGKEDKLLQTILSELEEVLGASIDWSTEKGVAECNFTAVFEKLPKPEKYEPVAVGEEIVYQPFSIYPHMSRDIALWASDTTAEVVEAVLNEHAGDLRVRTDLFDEFEKDGQISYAFRLVFQSPNRTLTDDVVNTIMDDVYQAVTNKGWEVR